MTTSDPLLATLQKSWSLCFTHSNIVYRKKIPDISVWQTQFQLWALYKKISRSLLYTRCYIVNRRLSVVFCLYSRRPFFRFGFLPYRMTDISIWRPQLHVWPLYRKVCLSVLHTRMLSAIQRKDDRQYGDLSSTDGQFTDKLVALYCTLECSLSFKKKMTNISIWRRQFH